MEKISAKQAYYRLMDKLGLDYGKKAFLMSKAKYWKRVEDIIKATQESRSMSDMDIMLQEVEHDTGYKRDFIFNVICESYEEDGFSWNEAIDSAITVAYEFDY